ncbi:MAG: hypothetical protein ABI717_07900, partial [Actinomycetota bacterium]
YRYTVTHSTLTVAAGTRVTVTFNAGRWTYGGVASVVPGSQAITLEDKGFIDVVYNGAAGVALDATTITGNEITITGPGTGTGITVLSGAPGSTTAPSMLADGKTVRYYLTGYFVEGKVTVTFAAGSWGDTAGSVGEAGTASFRVTDALSTADVPTPSTTPSRVFFIEISGKISLEAFGFLDEPILEIRGKVVLEIGQVNVGGVNVTRFSLDASGTVKVIKLGNIASGAAHLVLEIGGGLGNTKLYGVAAFETNLAFLHPYADLTGRVVLMINTTDTLRTETISLEGVPGDAIFALNAGDSATAITALNAAAGSLYSKVDLPGAGSGFDWMARFQTPPATTSPLLLDHGVELTIATFGGLSSTALEGAKIEKVSAADEWRVTLADGSNYFIQKAKNAALANILVVKGTERTFNLAPESFSLAVAGRFAVDDPSKPGNDFQLPDENWLIAFGAFYVQITTTKLVVFATAEGTFTPLGLSGHQTGLLILQYGGAGSTAGVAGMFDLGLSLTPPPGGGGLTSIADVFSFQGRVQVMFNTTLQRQEFEVPSVFRDLLPVGSPTVYTIFKTIPNINGSGPVDPVCEANPGCVGTAYILATISGTVTLFNTITLTGFFSITVGGGPTLGAIIIAGAVGTTIQHIGTLSGTIHFLFYTDFQSRGPAIIGRASLAFADGGGIPGVSIGGQVILEVNTLPGAATIHTFQLDAAGNLVFDSSGIVLATQTIGSNVAADDFDVRLVVKGHLTVGSLIRINGKFTFVLRFTPSFLIAASLEGELVLGDFGQVAVSGGFNVDSSGLALRLALTLSGGFGGSLGLQFSAGGFVELNTSSSPKTIGSVSVAPGFRVSVNGEITFLGFASASGQITLSVSADTFELSFDVMMHLGPIDVAASGFAGIYTGGSAANKGIVLRLAVSLNVNVLEIIKINASGELRLNTTGIARNANGVTIGARSFRLSLNGSLRILEVIKFDASFDLIVGGGEVTVGSGVQRRTFDLGVGEWVFAFSASADFFGLATMSISGWINSFGEFDVQVNGRLVLGTSSFGLVGEFSIRVFLYTRDEFGATHYHFHVDFSASVDARLFGISFASVGISGTFDAEGAGGEIEIRVSVTVRIKILFVKVSKTARFTIGTIRLPPPIYLAGNAGADPQNTGQPAWAGASGDGNLYLNMGSRAGVNGLGSGINESFIVEHISGSALGET